MDPSTGSSSSSSDPRLARALPGPLSFAAPADDSIPEVAPPEPGRELGGFRLVRRIGRGGMGEVWEAEQIGLGRRVALKFVRPDGGSARRLEYFAREARASGRLAHPGLVSVYASGELEGLAWIAMELVVGGRTLRGYLEETARAPSLPADYDRRVARSVAEIAEAMSAAHAAGVVHRDLKPQNVLVTADGHPKVSDFGLALIADETAISRTGELAGTYAYMSPEQVRGRREEVGEESDVFSLGVILYELLTLRRPFEGDTSQQILAQIVDKDPPDPRTIRSRIPDDLAVVALKALRKERGQRYTSMKALAADLRRFLAGEPVHARPPTPWERAAKWARRHPGRSAVAIAAVLAVGTITILWIANQAAADELALLNIHLDEQRRSAEAAAGDARARLDQLLRLSALQDLEDLVAEADDPDHAWPAHAERIPFYEEWIVRARRLAADLPAHRTTLAELQARPLDGLRPPEGARTAGAGEPADEASAATATDPPAARTEEAELRWWILQQTKLIDGLEALLDESTGLLGARAISPRHGWSVPRRLERARELERSFGSDGEHRRRWEAALPALRAAYPGLELDVLTGLVPLGPDPSSGLWEFWHVLSGEEPQRDASGRHAIAERTGLVLVLLPGGDFHMGAQSSQPAAMNYDPAAEEAEGPVHRVRLSPFLVSKHEMTQGQWLALTGANPSAYGPHATYRDDWNAAGRAASLRHPVETVSWLDCEAVLARVGLCLPSEAQWEYAARGGSGAPWSFGADPAALAEHGNVVDAWCAAHGAPSDWNYERWSDGETVHAPVGSFRPNAFGLHDVHGNLWEWCRDGYDSFAYERAADAEPPLDPVVPTEGLPFRSYRGGGFFGLAAGARSANRGGDTPPSGTDVVIGVRPALELRAGG